MAYSDYTLGCNDPAFPVMFSSMTVNSHTYLNNDDLDFYRLSSDPPLSSGQAAGLTQHADRVEGFSTNANFAGTGRTLWDIVLRNCLGKGRSGTTFSSDCHNHVLGDIYSNGGNYELGR